jgi:hypothetical protein
MRDNTIDLTEDEPFLNNVGENCPSICCVEGSRENRIWLPFRRYSTLTMARQVIGLSTSRHSHTSGPVYFDHCAGIGYVRDVQIKLWYIELTRQFPLIAN